MNSIPVTPPDQGPVALLSELASRLAAGGDVVATVTQVVERFRDALGADEASLWMDVGQGLQRTVLAGAAGLDGGDVLAAAAHSGGSADVIASRLAASGQGIGLLAVRSARNMVPDAPALTRIVANLLAPELAHAEDKHRLTGEVARTTKQVESERRFTARIIDSLPLGLYVIDRDYRVAAWNRNRETGHQGVSREDAIGRPIFEVLHRQPADQLRAAFDSVFESGRIEQFNVESSASGTRRTFRISRIPMRLDGTQVTHVISIGEDVTEWANAQERFAQSEKLAAIGQLVAGVMHEINNPLATVSACAESVSHHLDDLRQAGSPVPPQADESIRVIGQEVQRCKDIVDSLLTFSRPRSRSLAATDLNTVVRQTLFLLKHHAQFRQIQVQTILDEKLPGVRGDGEQLIQVFMALLLNASDAMAGSGRVTIRTRAGDAGEGVIAEVIDEGSGIARTDLPRIFEPFFTTKPPGRGTGLGLSVCYSIVEDHGGRIEVDSAPAAGSTFRILLPLPEGSGPVGNPESVS